MDEAEELLSSLVNAADEVPHLRSIDIRVILKQESWRDRAEMRRKWTSRLEEVFLHENTAPVPVVHPGTTHKATSRRQSKRIATQDTRGNSSRREETDHSSDSEQLPRQGRCSKVAFSVSDQRPAAEQYAEADFMDSEKSGDEDWTAGGRGEDAGYAW